MIEQPEGGVLGRSNMEMSRSGPNVKRLIMVPALIALAITIVRLVGELAGGSSALFSSEAGGGGALVGIVWLVPIFGVYFAIKLVRQGFGPESAGKVIGLAVLGLVAAVTIVLPVILITRDPNAGVSLVPRSINMVTFVASATASSSRSDDDAMSVRIAEEEGQRNRCRPVATLRADGGCGRSLCLSLAPAEPASRCWDYTTARLHDRTTARGHEVTTTRRHKPGNYLVIRARKRISKVTVITMRRYISCRNLDFSSNSS